MTQQSIANPSLELKLYGSTAKEIQLTGTAGNENNPTHVWTGLCSTPCALAFRHKANYRFTIVRDAARQESAAA